MYAQVGQLVHLLWMCVAKIGNKGARIFSTIWEQLTASWRHRKEVVLAGWLVGRSTKRMLSPSLCAGGRLYMGQASSTDDTPPLPAHAPCAPLDCRCSEGYWGEEGSGSPSLDKPIKSEDGECGGQSSTEGCCGVFGSRKERREACREDFRCTSDPCKVYCPRPRRRGCCRWVRKWRSVQAFSRQRDEC